MVTVTVKVDDQDAVVVEEPDGEKVVYANPRAVPTTVKRRHFEWDVPANARVTGFSRFPDNQR